MDRGTTMTKEDSLTLYSDAEKLLSLAEKLQEKCEFYERRKWLGIFFCTGSIMAMLFLSLYIAYRPYQEGKGSLVAGMLCGYAISCIIPTVYLWSQYSRLITREQRALHSIVDMLRDLETGISEESNLTTLERAEFRIRLSRFDIGPGWSEHRPAS